jgi:hypothetical protein
MGQIALFDVKGNPVVYIDSDDDGTIYTFSGVPLAYVYDDGSIYGFNGKHLGWFEDGIVWDHKGGQVGFIESRCPVFTKFQPFKGFKQFKPFKGFRQFAPFRPFKKYSTSAIPLNALLGAGR